MAKTGSILDILRVGIARETEANVFYNLLSQYVNNPDIVQICKEFAAEELEHKANLELEVFKLGETTSKNSTITSKPLDYMVDLSKVMNLNYPDLLILAMAKEKEAFRFYIELYSLTDKQEFREVLMEMAEEEARHKLRFEIQYDLYVSGKK
ncbi:MAG: ferritin family protein [Phycisphaerales bacterium]